MIGKYVDSPGSDQASDCIDCIAGTYIDVPGSDQASDFILVFVTMYASIRAVGMAGLALTARWMRHCQCSAS